MRENKNMLGELTYTSLENLVSKVGRLGAEMVDKRPSGGCLWIIPNGESDKRAIGELVGALPKYKYSFGFTQRGGAASGHRPAWYIKDEMPDATDGPFAAHADSVGYLLSLSL